MTAYWDDETEAVSTDSGALWSVGVTGAPWDTLVSTPDGTFATSQDGRKLMSESGTETPDVGSSAAMVDARLSRISVRDYGYRLEVSDDDGVTWTMAALNEADPYIRSVHVVDGQFYTVASLAPHQVHRLGGAYAVPLWRVLRVATPDATDPARQLDVDWLHAVGLGSEKDCSTVTAFPDATMEFELDGWTTYTAKSGVVDLSHPSSEEGAYLATLVHSPRAQTARVFFSARDSGRLWMNGKRLDGGPTFRRPNWIRRNALRHVARVELREGHNVLLLKVGGYTASFAAVHFAEAEGLTCSVSANAVGRPLEYRQPLWIPIADEPASGEITDLVALRDGALYAGTEGHGVLRFNQADRAWDELNDGLPNNEYVFVYDFLTLGNTLYAATSHGVYRLPPNSERWEARNGGLTDFYATALAASADWTFAGTWEGRIYRSPDRGESWEQVYGAFMKAESVAAR